MSSETNKIALKVIDLQIKALKKLKNSVKIASKNKFVVNHPSYNKDNVSGVVLKSIISYLDYYR